jgi:anti-anti-sigma factor
VELAIIEDASQGRTIVKLSGELDIAGAPDLREELLAILSRRTLSHLILDLSKLRFIDSSGIAVFVNTERRARLLGCTFALVAPQAPVSRVLQVCGLDQYFLIVENISAVAADEHPGVPGPCLGSADRTGLKPRNVVDRSQPEPTGAAPIEGIGLQLQYWSAVRARGACLARQAWREAGPASALGVRDRVRFRTRLPRDAP